MKVDYYSYKEDDFSCPECKWKGNGAELRDGEFSEIHAIGDLHCPNCGCMIAYWQASLSQPQKDENDSSWNKRNLRAQELLLRTKSIADFHEVFHVCDQVIANPQDEKAVSNLIQRVYQSGLIFGFDWMRWDEGIKRLEGNESSVDHCLLLELSMFITLIFRADRFACEGILDLSIKNGKLLKIVNALKLKLNQ